MQARFEPSQIVELPERAIEGKSAYEGRSLFKNAMTAYIERLFVLIQRKNASMSASDWFASVLGFKPGHRVTRHILEMYAEYHPAPFDVAVAQSFIHAIINCRYGDGYFLAETLNTAAGAEDFGGGSRGRKRTAEGGAAPTLPAPFIPPPITPAVVDPAPTVPPPPPLPTVKGAILEENSIELKDILDGKYGAVSEADRAQGEAWPQIKRNLERALTEEVRIDEAMDAYVEGGGNRFSSLFMEAGNRSFALHQVLNDDDQQFGAF